MQVYFFRSTHTERTILWENIDYQKCPKIKVLKLNKLDDIIEILKVEDVVPPFQKMEMCIFI